MSDPLRRLIDRIETATNARHRLVLTYADQTGAVSIRPVRPLGLWFWGKVWTMVGWCELRADFRMFRLDRIKTVEASGTFRPEKGKTLRDFYAMDAHHRPDL
jgi:predicted DNA-binding transcriptional regulator YafY